MDGSCGVAGEEVGESVSDDEDASADSGRREAGWFGVGGSWSRVDACDGAIRSERNAPKSDVRRRQSPHTSRSEVTPGERLTSSFWWVTSSFRRPQDVQMCHHPAPPHQTVRLQRRS